MSPRDSRVVFGENDAIRIAMGWNELKTGPRPASTAGSGDVGDIYLLNASPVTSATVTFSNGAGEAQCWHDNAGELVLLGSVKFDAPAGSWAQVTIPVSSDYQSGNPLHIRLDAPGGVDVAEAVCS